MVADQTPIYDFFVATSTNPVLIESRRDFLNGLDAALERTGNSFYPLHKHSGLYGDEIVSTMMDSNAAILYVPRGAGEETGILHHWLGGSVTPTLALYDEGVDPRWLDFTAFGIIKSKVMIKEREIDQPDVERLTSTINQFSATFSADIGRKASERENFLKLGIPKHLAVQPVGSLVEMGYQFDIVPKE